jgi:hypothetical protein
MNIPIKGLIFWKESYKTYLTCETCAKSELQELDTLRFNDDGDLECCSCLRTWFLK